MEMDLLIYIRKVRKMLIPRKIEDVVRKASATFPVLLLTGPRQTGKTTLLEGLCGPERKRVSLGNISARAQAKEDPELFLQRYSPPVLIEEIQYAPELMTYIKIMVDERKRCGDFWLTSSVRFSDMRGVTESLAGRMGIVNMLGLSNSEINGCRFPQFTLDPSALKLRMEDAVPLDLPEIFARICKGSLPRLYQGEDIDTERYFEDYLDSFLVRDVRDFRGSCDLTAFLRFMKAAAARTATNVNYEDLAHETGVSAPTARDWLYILVACGLVILIEPYTSRALGRHIRSPRMYFTDTGLCSHLLGWGSAKVLERCALSGAFFETWAVGEIYKSYLNAGRRPPLFFYRDSNKKEIDLIIYQNGAAGPIAIRKGSAPKDAVRNFSVLRPLEKPPGKRGPWHLRTNIGTGAVICMSEDVLPIDEKNWYVPAWLI